MAFTGSKLTIRALEQGVKYVQELKQTISLQIFLRHPPGVFIVNFEHISYLVLLFLLLTLNLQLPAGRNWIFTKTFTDKPLQQTLSWIYSCIIHLLSGAWTIQTLCKWFVGFDWEQRDIIEHMHVFVHKTFDQNSIWKGLCAVPIFCL